MNAFLNRVDTSEAGVVSWGAIIAGVVAAMGIASLLNLLGLSMGLASFSPDSESMKSLGIATVIWLIFNGVISMFAGGWVAGLLAGKLENRVEYMLHGFLMWSIALMLTFWVATTSVGYVVSGVLGATQKTLAAAGKGVAEVSNAVGPQVKNVVTAVIPMDGNFMKGVTSQAQDIFKKAQDKVQKSMSENETAGASSLAQEALANSNEDFVQATSKLFAAKGNDKIEETKSAVVKLLVDNGDMSDTRANQVVDKWYDRYQHLKDKAQAKTQQAKEYAVQAADKTASVLTKLALVSLIVALLGAVAACAGAVIASHKEELP